MYPVIKLEHTFGCYFINLMTCGLFEPVDQSLRSDSLGYQSLEQNVLCMIQYLLHWDSGMV